MALDMFGNVWTWGDNGDGQLGNGTNDPCTTPVKVVGRNGAGYLENIVAISAGYWHCMAVDSDGTVWTWGYPSVGSLGLGPTVTQNDSNSPHPIGVVYNLTQQTFHFGIQPAIDDVNNIDDVLEASQATYFERIDFLTKTIKLKNSDPNNWGMVQDTIIHNPGFQDYGQNEPAVKFNNNQNSTLTGFTIITEKYGYKDEHGIMCNSSSPYISNCIVENRDHYGLYCVDNSNIAINNCRFSDNDSYGIYCYFSDVNISECSIMDNSGDGIYSYGCDLIVHKSWIRNNSSEGIYIEYPSTVSVTNNIISDNNDHGIFSNISSSINEIEIKNNWIYSNGADDSGNGILFDNGSEPDIPVVVRNNTIASNADYGIELIYESPEHVNISNCILWDNPDGELENCTATYSCVKNGGGGTNIESDPCFFDSSTDNYHLKPYSLCIDNGTGNFPDETDIDGEDRTINGITDRGGDEFYRSPVDFDDSNTVNFIDYAMFATVWATQLGDQDYNDIYDLEDNNAIDYNDLSIFCDYWLWEAAWAKSEQMMMAMGGGGDGFMSMDSLSVDSIKLQSPQPVYMTAQQRAASVSEILDWLDSLWQSGELQDYLTYEEYLEFRESIEEVASQ